MREICAQSKDVLQYLGFVFCFRICAPRNVVNVVPSLFLRSFVPSFLRCFGRHRSVFGVRRSVFGVRCSVFGVRCSVFGVRLCAVVCGVCGVVCLPASAWRLFMHYYVEDGVDGWMVGWMYVCNTSYDTRWTVCVRHCPQQAQQQVRQFEVQGDSTPPSSRISTTWRWSELCTEILCGSDAGMAAGAAVGCRCWWCWLGCTL